MKYLITLLLVSLSLQAQEYINWQPFVLKKSVDAHSAHGGHGRGKSKQFQVNNCEHNATTKAYYLMPTLERKELTPEHGVIALPRTGMDNYHALVINQTMAKKVSSSIRYIYSRGRPSKVSPTKITKYEKSLLEIEPTLLPREHDKYKSSNRYLFKLRFKGGYLEKHKVIFKTSAGTTNSFTTEKNGEFSVEIPNDFKDVKNGRRKNKSQEFVLQASYDDANILHTTTLSMPYYVNPVNHWQDRWMGAIVLFIGLVIGLYLFRNINKKKKRKA